MGIPSEYPRFCWSWGVSAMIASGPVAAFYTVDETADKLGLSKTTIHRLIRSGELGHTRLTRWIRISPEDIAAYLERSHRQAGVPSQTARHRRPRQSS